jgi:hypothetical protein
MSAPTPPDPAATAAAQAQYNQQAAQSQAEINMVNQTTPYGSLTYNQTGTAADGTPMYSANTQLNAPEQNLFNQTVNTQGQLASDAGQLATNLGSSLTSAPDLSNSALTSQLLGWQSNYMQPYFKQQTSNLNSQLQNQGITEGSQAYNNAVMATQQNQNTSMENAMAGDEAQAYQQAAQTYQLPIQTLGTLLGEGAPASVNSSLTQTPSESVQAPNYEGLAEQNYAQQNAQYGQLMGGLFSVPSAVLGGWAKSGFSSDRRKKKDITRIGWMNDGTPIYRFRYLDDPRMTIGVMAQDLLESKPDAIFIDPDGFMMVDYEAATNHAAYLGGVN